METTPRYHQLCHPISDSQGNENGVLPGQWYHHDHLFPLVLYLDQLDIWRCGTSAVELAVRGISGIVTGCLMARP